MLTAASLIIWCSVEVVIASTETEYAGVELGVSVPPTTLNKEGSTRHYGPSELPAEAKLFLE